MPGSIDAARGPWSPRRRSAASTVWPIAWMSRSSRSPTQFDVTWRRRPEYGPCSLWMLAAMRRRASSRPSLCGRSTSIGRFIGRDVRRPFAAFQARRGCLCWADDAPAGSPCSCCCSRRCRRPRRRQRWQPGRRLCHRRPGRARLSRLGRRRPPGGRSMSRRSTIIWSPMASAGSSRPGSCCAPRATGSRCGAQPFEVPPTSAWPNIVAALRYVGAYVIPRDRAGRGRCRSIATRRSTPAPAARRKARTHYGRDRHGAAAADHAARR